MTNQQKNEIDFICHSHGNSKILCGDTRITVREDSYKLFYLAQGSCEIDIDGTCYEIEEGGTAVVFPFCKYQIHQKENAVFYWVEVSGFTASAILQRIAFSKSKPVVGNIGIPGFERFFELPDINDRAPYALYRMGGSLFVLISYYLEHFPSKSAETESYVAEACAYIEERFTEPAFGVKDVAERLKIDRSYLYRLFKDKMGISIIDYIVRRRVAKSETLLGNSRLSIKDVAYSSGFSDQMYFSRVFKKLNGRTPTAFRKMIFPPHGDI